MNSINDLILELTTTCKTPDGISIYKAESYSTPKSLPELFSEVDGICDELSDDKLYNLILLLSSIGESGFKNSEQ